MWDRRLLGGAIGRAAILAAILVLDPAGARADAAGLEEATRLYEEAEFEQAKAALARTEAKGELSRSELLRWLTLKALVEFALNDLQSMKTDVTMLASLAPEYDLGMLAPPDVQRAFDEAGQRLAGALTLEVNVQQKAGAVAVDTQVRNDPAGVVQRLRSAARLGSTGQWYRGGSNISLPAAHGTTVEYYVEAIGLGGALVARVGSTDDPARHALRGAAPSTAAPTATSSTDTTSAGAGPTTDGDPDAGGGSPWVWVGTGLVVVAAAGAVVAAVLSTGGGAPNTRVSLPMTP